MELKKLRISQGLTPSFVARKLGISYRQFNRIENGEGYLTEERIEILSKLYNVKKSQITE